jgi:hypothetical protein
MSVHLWPGIRNTTATWLLLSAIDIGILIATITPHLSHAFD